MRQTSAYIVRLSNERQQAFNDNLHIRSEFAEPVGDFTYSSSLPLICVLVNPQGRITHIGKGARGNRAGTELRRLNISELTPLTTRLSVRQLLDALPKGSRRHAKPRFEKRGLLPPKTFEHVADAIARLAPETRKHLERFTEQSRRRLAELTREQKTAYAFQKESLATAMYMAGISRESLADWTIETEEPPKSFLDGLSEVCLREDQMVVNDMMSVPGYDLLEKVPNVSAARFSQKPRYGDVRTTLTVILANRLPLEQQTGTDLVYYNERFKSCIMVQYKAMEKRSGHPAIFRFPDSQLTTEIDRMDRFLSELRKCKSSSDCDAFRLSDNPFFLKFCSRLQFNPDDTGLVSGMYLPLSYWKSLATHETMNGPRGGKRLIHENARRYMDNSEFTTIVRHAWVGTTITQSAILEDWISDVLKSGKAITFAVRKDVSEDSVTGGESLTNPLTDEG